MLYIIKIYFLIHYFANIINAYFEMILNFFVENLD